MSKAIAAAVVIGFLSTGHAAAQEDSTEKLIDKLGSTVFAERDRASRLLRERGPKVLPALRKASNHADAEVRRRVRELIPILEAVLALEPTRITLKDEAETLAEILRAIEKQAGCKFADLEQDDERQYRCPMKRVLFWEAMERIGAESKRVVSLELNEPLIQLKPRDTRPLFAQINGPFRIEMTKIHEDRDLDFTKSAKKNDRGILDHWLTLNLTVLAEPRFKLLGVERTRIDVAEDGDGNAFKALPPVPAKPPEEIWRQPLVRDFQQNTTILLKRSSEKSRTIKHLRGSIDVNVLVGRKFVVVTEKFLESKGTKFSGSGETLQITEAYQEENGRYRFRVDVPPSRFSDRMCWVDRIFLEDLKGHRYAASGSGWSTANGVLTSVSVNYEKPKDAKVGPPCRLVFEDWITLRHTIPFTFKDIPLP